MLRFLMMRFIIFLLLGFPMLKTCSYVEIFCCKISRVEVCHSGSSGLGGNQYPEVSHELSHLPTPQLLTPKGAPTEIEKSTMHCTQYLFWGFLRRNLCIAWNSKEIPTSSAGNPVRREISFAKTFRIEKIFKNHWSAGLKISGAQD